MHRNTLWRAVARCAAQALLAGGTFNGELIIWDLNKDDATAQVCGTLSQFVHVCWQRAYTCSLQAKKIWWGDFCGRQCQQTLQVVLVSALCRAILHQAATRPGCVGLPTVMLCRGVGEGGGGAVQDYIWKHTVCTTVQMLWGTVGVKLVGSQVAA
jgi:hypothetical protein